MSMNPAKRTVQKKKYDGAVENIFTIAEGLLTGKQHNHNVEKLVQLLIDCALDLTLDRDPRDRALRVACCLVEVDQQRRADEREFFRQFEGPDFDDD